MTFMGQMTPPLSRKGDPFPTEEEAGLVVVPVDVVSGEEADVVEQNMVDLVRGVTMPEAPLDGRVPMPLLRHIIMEVKIVVGAVEKRKRQKPVLYQRRTFAPGVMRC
jgi:hypothetical protein